jgi:hypothetical protein
MKQAIQLPNSAINTIARGMTTSQIKTLTQVSKSTKRVGNAVLMDVKKKSGLIKDFLLELIALVRSGSVSSFKIMFDNGTGLTYQNGSYNSYNTTREVDRGNIMIKYIMNEIFRESITPAQFPTEEETQAYQNAVENNITEKYAIQLGPYLSNVKTFEILELRNPKRVSAQTQAQAQAQTQAQAQLEAILQQYIENISMKMGGGKRLSQPVKVPKKKKVN